MQFTYLQEKGLESKHSIAHPKGGSDHGRKLILNWSILVAEK